MERMETLDEVNREGQERLHPSLMNPSWLVLRKRREIFQRWMSGLDGGGLAVLDVGGRIQPYRPLLEGRLRTYVALDLRRSPLVDIVASGAQIPLASGVFDLVLCSQVLEYVPRPETVIAEVYRVLKPGGALMLSVPAVFPRDSEQDSWRFLPQSLRILLHSFCEVEIAPEGTSIAGFFRTLCVCLSILFAHGLVSRLFRLTLVPALNVTGFCLESVFANSNDQFTANFGVLAKK
jgi:SAM-dependent methyltransferase